MEPSRVRMNYILEVFIMKKVYLTICTAGLIIGTVIGLGDCITYYGNAKFKKGLELGTMAGRAERDIEYLKRKPEEENDD